MFVRLRLSIRDDVLLSCSYRAANDGTVAIALLRQAVEDANKGLGLKKIDSATRRLQTVARRFKRKRN